MTTEQTESVMLTPAPEQVLPERLWCVACGTVTRDRRCDCNMWGDTDCIPNFVNYADELQRNVREACEDLNEAADIIDMLRIVVESQLVRDGQGTSATPASALGRARTFLKKHSDCSETPDDSLVLKTGSTDEACE